MNDSLVFPDDLDSKRFLRDIWQQRALYMPGALAGFSDPLEPEELAGLACEAEIAARLIVEQPPGNWQVRHNPFTDEDFTSLPETHWTVLVQDLNRHIPDLDLLLDAFGFLPGWRIDDVMVSYAAPGGTVGPHTDQYDVFLLQGMGTRRWQISTSDDNRLIDGLDLKILEHFEPEQEFVLHPGDILYLPPGVQHYGVSDEPCMTYSIGLRAPTQLELAGDYIDMLTLAGPRDDEPRYADPGLAQQPPGEITGEALAQVIDLVTRLPRDEAAIRQWFGRFITTTHRGLDVIPLQPGTNPGVLLADFMHGTPLYRDPASRFAYVENSDGIDIFIDACGTTMTGTQAELAKHVCNHRVIYIDDSRDMLQDDAAQQLLAAWLEAGLLDYVDEG